jgi:hypothetical protein
MRLLANQYFQGAGPKNNKQFEKCAQKDTEGHKTPVLFYYICMGMSIHSPWDSVVNSGTKIQAGTIGTGL